MLDESELLLHLNQFLILITKSAFTKHNYLEFAAITQICDQEFKIQITSQKRQQEQENIKEKF